MIEDDNGDHAIMVEDAIIVADGNSDNTIMVEDDNSDNAIMGEDDNSDNGIIGEDDIFQPVAEAVTSSFSFQSLFEGFAKRYV